MGISIKGIPRAKMPTLRYKTAENIVRNIDAYIRPYLYTRRAFRKSRPDFGFFSDLDDGCCRLILELLILENKLSYTYLAVILPSSTTDLKCNELLGYSPYSLNVLNLISERCPNFTKLHYHYSYGASNNIFYLEKLWHQSLLNLSTHVMEIDLSDAAVSGETMRIISVYFVSLRHLILDNTYMLPNAFEHLINSSFDDQLQTLIVDGTTMPFNCVAAILNRFENMGYFRCDSTIRTAHALLTNPETNQKTFKTTVLKQNFKSFNFDMPLDEIKKVARGLRHMFKKVETLILAAISNQSIPYVNHIIPMFSLVKLKLSGFNTERNYTFSELHPAFDSDNSHKLVSITLEYFLDVDLTFLSRRCENLEKLNLINNTYVDDDAGEISFLQLTKLEILFFSELLTKDEREKKFQIKKRTLKALMSAVGLERIVIREQDDFGGAFEELLNANEFRKLTTLGFYECLIENNSLLNIFNHDIPLEYLGFTVGYVNGATIQKIKDIIKENSYITVLTVATKTPYRQHMKFVDMPIFRKKGEMVCL